MPPGNETSRPSIPGYTLQEEIGRGGMGVVYRARDLGFERDVAIKLLSDKFDAESFALARFRNEARITGQLQHPGIPAAHELGTLADGKPFLAMKLVKGATLQAMLDQRKDSSDERGKFIAIFEQVCHAVGYAHAHQVIHRDLKPSNIMVGKFGEVQIMDWGLAKVLGRERGDSLDKDETESLLFPDATTTGDEVVSDAQTAAFDPSKIDTSEKGDSATRTGSVLGTPAYMPPEQAKGEIRSLDARSDVFSLGAILCQILTGKPLYVGRRGQEVYALSVLGATQDAIERIEASGADTDLISLAKKCLAREQHARPADGQVVANEVATIRIEAETRARTAEKERSEAIIREAESQKRRKQFLMAASLIGLVLVLGISGTGIGLVLALASAGAERAAKEKALSAEGKERKAKEVATLKQKEAETERARAEEREQEAIAAVKRFGDTVANNPELKNSLGLHSLRKALLKEPLGFFKSLKGRLEENRSTQKDSLARLAAAADDLGFLTREIGDKQDALIAYEDAKTIWERLAREHPSTIEFQNELAASQRDLGSLLGETGKPQEAIQANQQAIRILEKLVKDNPTETEFQCDLAGTQNNLGGLLTETGQPEAALAAYEAARKIRQKLVRENPEVAEFQFALAQSYNNLGTLFSEIGLSDDAMRSYLEAKRIQKKLARENPTIFQFDYDLANSLLNLGGLFLESNQLPDALAAYEESKEIFRRLAQENPTNSEYSNSLAIALSNWADLLRVTGKPAKALTALNEAIGIRERLAKENPSVVEFQSGLGAVLHNLATHNLEAKEWLIAKELLQRAIQSQKLALAKYPQHLLYRQFLGNHYACLEVAASELQDKQLLAECQSGLAELAASDPQFAELDQQLTAIEQGGAAKTAPEMAALGQRAHTLKKFSLAATLFSDALSRNPELAVDRQLQLPYNAACSFALASNGEGVPGPALDDAAKTQLRAQAQSWLRQDLTQWQKFLGDRPTRESKQTVAQALAHWQEDLDLDSIRAAEKLAALPEEERKTWESLWAEVKSLQEKVAAEAATSQDKPSTPNASPLLGGSR